MLILFWFGSVAQAQEENNDLIDAIHKKDLVNISKMQEKLEFSQFKSCMDMETMLWEFLKQFPDDGWNRPYPLLRWAEMDLWVDVISAKTATPIAESNGNTAENVIETSSTTDFSHTNLQKAGVDEPEIIKSNGNEIFYYNRQEQKIYIIKSPLDRNDAHINMDSATILTEINLPEQLNNPQLFLTKDRLVILASRYISLANSNRILNREARTSIAIYDISNPKDVSLIKFSDLDGYYQHSRMIDNKLYVLSELDINRRNLKENKHTFNEKLLPKVLDIDIRNQALKIIVPECDAISYVLPSQDTIKKFGMYPVFTIVSVVDVENVNQDTHTNVVLANAGQIHMSTDSLYIAQTLWMPTKYRCPLESRCLMPWVDEGQNTLIHKFSLDNFDINYKASNMLPGSLLTQYSMDEDSHGNFRILTRKNWSDGTNFYALDPNLVLKGMIDGIQPNEQFKASRYIGDKLYLVTFKQTDPLFVIDIADISHPKIIGELKVPGFSTYLHPLWTLENNIQYLIGLWYWADEKWRQSWLQLSLYKIDYSSKDPIHTWNIRIDQIDRVVLWGQWSFSEAMENPRMFVMDQNNVVTLPMVLIHNQKGGERCTVYRDANGVETQHNCYPVTKQLTDFVGIKSFSFDKTDGISTKSSIDYIDTFQKLYKSNNDYSDLDIWKIRNLDMRVWFVGDVLYTFNNDFANFVVPGTDSWKYISFDKRLK